MLEDAIKAGEDAETEGPADEQRGEPYNDTPEEQARADETIAEVEQPSEAAILCDAIRDAADLAELDEVETKLERALARLKGDDITELRGRIKRRRDGLKGDA
jgi:hypothetical protein